MTNFAKYIFSISFDALLGYLVANQYTWKMGLLVGVCLFTVTSLLFISVSVLEFALKRLHIKLEE